MPLIAVVDVIRVNLRGFGPPIPEVELGLHALLYEALLQAQGILDIDFIRDHFHGVNLLTGIEHLLDCLVDYAGLEVILLDLGFQLVDEQRVLDVLAIVVANARLADVESPAHSVIARLIERQLLKDIELGFLGHLGAGFPLFTELLLLLLLLGESLAPNNRSPDLLSVVRILHLVIILAELLVNMLSSNEEIVSYELAESRMPVQIVIMRAHIRLIKHLVADIAVEIVERLIVVDPLLQEGLHGNVLSFIQESSLAQGYQIDGLLELYLSHFFVENLLIDLDILEG